MGNSFSSRWMDQSRFRLDRQDPYLRIQNVMIFVRDLERSLRFYVDQLGFSVVSDVRLPSGERWVTVAPPDGNAILALLDPKPESEEYKLIGQFTRVVFVTEDGSLSSSARITTLGRNVYSFRGSGREHFCAGRLR